MIIDTSTFPRTVIPSDGHTTCLIHRQWEWTMTHYVPHMPRCPLCGGIADPRAPTHPLCQARHARGLPTPPLDCTPRCSCAACAKQPA